VTHRDKFAENWYNCVLFDTDDGTKHMSESKPTTSADRMRKLRERERQHEQQLKAQGMRKIRLIVRDEQVSQIEQAAKFMGKQAGEFLFHVTQSAITQALAVVAARMAEREKEAEALLAAALFPGAALDDYVQTGTDAKPLTVRQHVQLFHADLKLDAAMGTTGPEFDVALKHLEATQTRIIGENNNGE
jgi:hypothetical protein